MEDDDVYGRLLAENEDLVQIGLDPALAAEQQATRQPQDYSPIDSNPFDLTTASSNTPLENFRPPRPPPLPPINMRLPPGKKLEMPSPTFDLHPLLREPCSDQGEMLGSDRFSNPTLRHRRSNSVTLNEKINAVDWDVRPTLADRVRESENVDHRSSSNKKRQPRLHQSPVRGLPKSRSDNHFQPLGPPAGEDLVGKKTPRSDTPMHQDITPVRGPKSKQSFQSPLSGRRAKKLDASEPPLDYKVMVKPGYGNDDSPQIERSPMKKLFGEGGFLGRSMLPGQPEQPDPRYRKSGLTVLKNKASNFAEEMVQKLRDPDKTKDAKQPVEDAQDPISLTPNYQAQFYAQVELLIQTEANRFIMYEVQSGRIDAQIPLDIAKEWQAKDRAAVVEYRYDIITQREILIRSFASVRWAGGKMDGRSKARTALHMWKFLAKELSVRTFCATDSVVRRQLLDVGMILEVIDASRMGVAHLADLNTAALPYIMATETALRQATAEAFEHGAVFNH